MSNQEKVVWYALTTLQRLKDRLGITIPDTDLLLTRYINAATDFIERECGKSGLEKYPNDGHFALKTYTNEVYSVRGSKQQKLVLRNAPVFYLIVSGNLTANSANVTVSPYTGIAVGMPLYAAQGLFPAGTTVSAVGANGALTMSQPAIITQNAATFEISGLISFQWRAGTPSNPSWTSFIVDQFELEEQGAAGIVRVYGVMPRLYSNMLRATYAAGYPLDWQNAGNYTGTVLTHLLPADLTTLCENLVERAFKRRGLAGKSSENIQGATIAWRNLLDDPDLTVIANYTRPIISA